MLGHTKLSTTQIYARSWIRKWARTWVHWNLYLQTRVNQLNPMMAGIPTSRRSVDSKAIRDGGSLFFLLITRVEICWKLSFGSLADRK
jgi:hypothetical protein